MPLLMLDLDDTLVDRSAAFARWAADFVAGHGGSTADVAAVIECDGGGYVPREQAAGCIAARLGIDEVSSLVEVLRRGLVEQMALAPTVLPALDEARAAGWSVVVVTNGTVTQQERKLRTLGIDARVDGWIVSEAAGVKKPDRRMFELAAERAAADLADSWMVGDHPVNDIAGAAAVGASTAWITGLPWPEQQPRPNLVAADVTEAITTILAR